MISLLIKEINQFFSSMVAYLIIGVFLLLCGLFLFVIPSTSLLDYNILDNGYATATKFFALAPWLLLLLIPAITMRLIADEYRQGTMELILTRPLRYGYIIWAKYLAALVVVLIALAPSCIYIIAIKAMATQGIDGGGTIGAYIGLMLLAATFTAVGICCSSFTSNAVVAYMSSLLVCLLLYTLCNGISRIAAFKGEVDYYIAYIGLDYHYRSICRGVLDTRNLLYFITCIALCITITYRNLLKR